MTEPAFTTVTEQEVFEEKLPQEPGIVRGVKLLGLRSRNRRNYDTPGVRKTALSLLNGQRVCIDHPATPEQPRSYRDSFGVTESVEYRAGHGYFGTIRYNPKHLMAEQFSWDVENNPKGLGMSINSRVAFGKTGKDGYRDVDSLEECRSIDIVTKPATTVGIFESETVEEEVMDLETLKKNHPDLFKQVLESEGNRTQQEAELESLRKTATDALEQLNTLKAEVAQRKIREAVEKDFGSLMESVETGDDKELRKDILECACELAEEPRKKFRGVVERLGKLIPGPEESEDGEDDDETSPANEQEEEPEPIKPQKPAYRPGAGRRTGNSLKAALGIT